MRWLSSELGHQGLVQTVHYIDDRRHEPPGGSSGNEIHNFAHWRHFAPSCGRENWDDVQESIVEERSESPGKPDLMAMLMVEVALDADLEPSSFSLESCDILSANENEFAKTCQTPVELLIKENWTVIGSVVANDENKWVETAVLEIHALERMSEEGEDDRRLYMAGYVPHSVEDDGYGFLPY